MFAFIVWVAARSLTLLWTTGCEDNTGPMPIDLESLLSTLQQLVIYWPSAQRYSDLIELILDAKNGGNSNEGLAIFNDTGHTSYGLQIRLGKLVARRVLETLSQTHDFLEIPILEAGGFTSPGMGFFGLQEEGEWLYDH